MPLTQQPITGGKQSIQNSKYGMLRKYGIMSVNKGNQLFRTVCILSQNSGKIGIPYRRCCFVFNQPVRNAAIAAHILE
jgi:hypothetical protein